MLTVLSLVALSGTAAATTRLAVPPAPTPAPIAVDRLAPATIAGPAVPLINLAALPSVLGATDPLTPMLETVAQKAGSSHAGSSGLPWRSGASCSGSEFVAWRGRKLDVVTGFAPQSNWSEWLRYFQRGNVRRVAAGGTASIGVPLLTNQSSGQISQCAAGAFDSYFKAAGAVLQSQGSGGSILRLGWEANNNSFAWKVGGSSATTWKRCFQRAVSALRSAAPGLQINWHMAKKGKYNGPVTDLYPGDTYVSMVSLSYYDRYPFNTNDGVWSQQYSATNKGGPYGIGAWLNFARSRGKRLAIGEWGVNDGYDRQGTDNAFFVGKMGQFFRANAGSIGYESYFNCRSVNPGMYMIYPTANNPRAAAAYLANWR